MLVLEQYDWHNKARRGVSNKNGLLVRQDEGGDKANSFARLASLDQIGELARRQPKA